MTDPSRDSCIGGKNVAHRNDPSLGRPDEDRAGAQRVADAIAENDSPILRYAGRGRAKVGVEEYSQIKEAALLRPDEGPVHRLVVDDNVRVPTMRSAIAGNGMGENSTARQSQPVRNGPVHPADTFPSDRGTERIATPPRNRPPVGADVAGPAHRQPFRPRQRNHPAVHRPQISLLGCGRVTRADHSGPIGGNRPGFATATAGQETEPLKTRPRNRLRTNSCSLQPCRRQSPYLPRRRWGTAPTQSPPSDRPHRYTDWSPHPVPSSWTTGLHRPAWLLRR